METWQAWRGGVGLRCPCNHQSFRPAALACSRRTVVGPGTAFSTRAALGEGVAVVVTAPITVYHSPKYKGGLPIKGYKGTILANVSQYKGKTLSANKPWKISLEAKDPNGKPLKLIVHLDERELQEVRS